MLFQEQTAPRTGSAASRTFTGIEKFKISNLRFQITQGGRRNPFAFFYEKCVKIIVMDV